MHHNFVSPRVLTRFIVCCALLLIAVCEKSYAQSNPAGAPIRGDRLGGFVLPIEPIDSTLSIAALRAHAWSVDDTRRLLLEGDVAISLGGYSFTATRALVWINRLPSEHGLINQVAIYFNRAGDPTKIAGTDVGGERLLITGSTRGEATLDVAHIEHAQPPRQAFLTEGEARLAEHLKQLISQQQNLQQRPQVSSPRRDAAFVPVPGGAIDTVPAPDAKTPTLPEEPAPPWLIGPTGFVRFAAANIEIASGEQDNTVTASGGIIVEVFSTDSRDTLANLTLTAERAVIFLKPGPLKEQATQFNADAVRGVYLEGNVNVMTHSGEYAIRAPQVYYDFASQKAIMVDSLLRIQPRDSILPVQARAAEMRQLSEHQWEVKRVTVSTSDFHQPHLAIGARRAVITRMTDSGNSGATMSAQHVAVNALGVPVFYWPGLEGDAQVLPLKNIEVGTRSNDGLRVLTTWDLLALANVEAQGVEADLKIDAFTKRGAGLGAELRYDVGDSEGAVDLYGLYDTGEDRTSSGEDVDPRKELRGVALLEHQMQLSEFWSLQAQFSLISDETFITSWREEDFAERREYETSLYLKHQRDNAALTLLGQMTLHDFLSNSYLLASRQYTVDRAPELTYRRYGDSLFGDALTFSTENRLTRMRMVFVDATPEELGVPGAAFGIAPTDNIADTLFASGMHEDWVSRFDSRHELSWPIKSGPLNVTPFVVGRFTWYDDEFEDYTTEGEQMRFFGAAGVRVATSLQRVHDHVESRLWDVHRIRHIVEPYVTVWASHTSLQQEHLPIYDETVESLADGAAVQVGVLNTWQTQRGGPGRWRSVDWIKLDTSVVFDSEGEPDESPTPQFFDYRPEYSHFGDHVRTRGMWLLSDSFTIAGDATYLLNDPMFARGSIGFELRHSPVLVTYVEYRNIHDNDLELIDFGWRYKITPKYQVAFSPQWDLKADKFRAVSLRLTRSFPDVDLTFVVRYDDIRDDTLFGASLGLTQF